MAQLSLRQDKTSLTVESILPDSGKERPEAALSHQNWYLTGIDFCFYAPAQEACAVSKERLDKLNLQDEDRRLAGDASKHDIKPGKIIEKLLEIQAEMEKKSTRRASAKTASKFVNSFSAFADKASSIIMVLLPQSPEYTVTLGVLFLLFKAVVTKKDREDALVKLIESISQRLPMTEFYKTIFPSNAIKASVARIYAHMVKILDEALVYFRGWRLTRLVDAFLNNASKFDDLLSDLDAEYKTMHELKDATHIVQTASIVDIVYETNNTITNLHNNLESQTSAINLSMSIINSKLHNLTAQTNLMLRFEMTKHARSLQEVLLGDAPDAQDELDAVVARGFKLSQKDHWENNGALHDIAYWSENERNLLLWIGGASGNQDSWVTETSVDIIRALEPRMVPVLFAFCDQPDEHRTTVMGLVRRLLGQLLDLRPELAYGRPDLCDTWRLKKRATTFEKLFEVFEQLAAQVQDLFIVVDRVDGCEADDSAGVISHLLPRLIEMSLRRRDVTVIVTSVYNPPEEIAELEFFPLYIDTGKVSRQL
ncbi:hypothetical protein B0T14DRAFT_250330 [Immersiella caudata]|uniref:Uncharacterized protein n=1 Tax=Immersiella caudata TaxID=314043 RepID=A0AA39WJP3_9PEZI|nr:hypothetical protein B0T14DRAFT_250330 [Immersiella caudata]